MLDGNERRRNDEEAAKEPDIPDKLKRDMQKILAENEMIDLLQLGNFFKQKSSPKKCKSGSEIGYVAL